MPRMQELPNDIQIKCLRPDEAYGIYERNRDAMKCRSQY